MIWRLARRLRNEDGITIVVAVVLMTVMIGAGLATYAQVDTQQGQARQQRVRESTFNFTEAVLNVQAFKLSRNWPASEGRAFNPELDATGETPPPPTCSPASGVDPLWCPQPTEVAEGYDSADYAAGVSWKTWVRDDEEGDPASQFFDWTAVQDRPAWDANGNGIVFVRAASTVRSATQTNPLANKTRTLVAQVQIERVDETLAFPERTVIAGSFTTNNNGNKIIVETNSTATSPHPVTVRCTDLTDDDCMKYRENTTPPQINPAGSVVGGEYVGQTALTPEMSERLKEYAIANGTYYTGCPSLSQLTGKVVWVEDVSSCSNYNSNATVNSSSSPGVLIIGKGTQPITLNGGLKFHGVIYHLNEDNSCEVLVDLKGTVEIYGRVFIDGCGKMSAGSSKVNITYDAFEDANDPFTSYGTAGIVQNSWRELVPADEDKN
jgi:hypothetical protein